MSNLKSIISVLSMLIIMIVYCPVSVKAADSAVSGLDNLGAAPAGVDELYLSRSGTDKALTIANLFLYLGAAYDTEAELLALFAGKQPLEATLTDIADGTINENLVNTANPWAVNEGGTGAATFTDGGILIGSGTNAFTALGQATDGQLPIGSTGLDPVLANITETTDAIVITNGAGSIVLSAHANVEAVADGLVASNALAHAKNEQIEADPQTVDVDAVSHYNGILSNDTQATGDTEFDLDAIVQGMSFSVYIADDDDDDVYLDPNGVEVIRLEGTALAGGFRVLYNGDQTGIGDELFCKAVTVAGVLQWDCKSVMGVWITAGS